MKKLKSERHHWWPETVSEFWKNSQGGVHWLRPDGSEKVLPAKQLGVIGNGHHIKFSSNPNEETVWDESFEGHFDTADSNFKYVIEWLEALPRKKREGRLEERFDPFPAPDNKIALLAECLVSLAVRSPMTREAAVSLAERLRGRLETRERNRIIGLNMRNMHKAAVKDIGVRGKFLAIYSPDREFIFGDGFFHNITTVNLTIAPRILAPLTPHISMLYARPTMYSTEPRFMTFVATRDETKFLNDMVQVYAKDAIYYSTERPEILDAFRQGVHRMYEFPHPLERLVSCLP